MKIISNKRIHVSLAALAMAAAVFCAVPASADTVNNTVSATFSGSVNPNGRLTTAWFEYGTDQNLINSSETVHVAVGAGINSLPFSEKAAGLTPGATYYFRLVTDNGESEVKGDILSLTAEGGSIGTTSSASPSSTSMAEEVSAPEPSNMLQISSATENPEVGSDVNYVINFENDTDTELDNAAILVVLPAQVDFIQSDFGQKEPNRQVLFSLGTVAKSQKGILTLKGRLNPSSKDVDSVIVTANMTYNTPDSPTLSKNQTAYAVTQIGMGTVLAASIFYGGDFFPHSLLGWIVLVGITLIIIIVTREILLRKKHALLSKGVGSKDSRDRTMPGPMNS